MSFFVLVAHLCTFMDVTPWRLRSYNAKLSLMVSERCQFKHSVIYLHLKLENVWITNREHVIFFLFLHTYRPLSLSRYDIAAFSASASKHILYAFLKDASLSLPLKKKNLSDVIFRYSGASSRL